MSGRPVNSNRALALRAAPHLAAVLALSAAAGLLLLASPLHNDHFDRISRARQIAEYGEVPFRDFMDPGYFLTLYASAFMQKVFGFNLLGEALLNLAGLAAGLGLVYFVASRVSGSRLTAFVAALLAVAAAPRLYDYDKVFFYPLGIALCWLYARRPTRTSLAALAIGTVLAGLFRYDNGIYVMSAAMVTIAAVHWRRWRAMGAAAAVYLAAGAAALAPALLFVAWHGGLVDAATQIATYAHREGGRTKILSPARLVIDWRAPIFVVAEAEPAAPLVKVRWAPDVDHDVRRRLEARYELVSGRRVRAERTWVYRLLNAHVENVRDMVLDHAIEDADGLDRGTYVVKGLPESSFEAWRRALPFLRVTVLRGFLNRENAAAWLYYVLALLPFVSVSLVLVRAPRWQGADVGRSTVPTVLAAATLCLLVDLFVVRDPIGARLGAVAVPATVLAAWLFARPPASAGSASGRAAPQQGARRANGAVLIARASRVLLVVLTVSSLGIVGPWRSLLGREGVFHGRFNGVSMRSYVRELRQSPPSLEMLPSSRMAGLVRYVRECTTPTDRVMATWFAPELYYYSGRAFAGGMAAFFGGHWSELNFQRRILTKLEAQKPPIVILNGSDGLRDEYAYVDDFIQRHYRLAGEVDSDDPGGGGFLVFVDPSRPQTGVYGHRALPCFGSAGY